ncbi:unnamed protein product [Angiostrongylus costaricensis]|uniref:Nuclear receptor domain-containing protein n=1 Tax=Angiostrongylus costaricensis TaxID=334426 RepID=A0A0R3PGS7_ANGCS|nr:unnamed protein product [Angiostrongylus costaricensis]
MHDLNEHLSSICRVCGDKAFSYNFNVITCESCKAFFRRNANKREIRCPFNEQCEINVVSRRFCQRCRLAKCFGVSSVLYCLSSFLGFSFCVKRTCHFFFWNVLVVILSVSCL